MEQYELDEMIEDFENQCAELGVHFPEGCLEVEAYRGCKWGVPSDKIRVEVPLTKNGSNTIEIEVGDALPNMFGVYRNYHGGGMCDGMRKSELDEERVANIVNQSLEDYTGKKANPQQSKRIASETVKRLNAYLDLCEKSLYDFEAAQYDDTEESWMGHHAGVLAVK